jgi:hypothetical protein
MADAKKTMHKGNKRRAIVQNFKSESSDWPNKSDEDVGGWGLFGCLVDERIHPLRQGADHLVYDSHLLFQPSSPSDITHPTNFSYPSPPTLYIHFCNVQIENFPPWRRLFTETRALLSRE